MEILDYKYGFKVVSCRVNSCCIIMPFNINPRFSNIWKVVMSFSWFRRSHECELTSEYMIAKFEHCRNELNILNL